MKSLLPLILAPFLTGASSAQLSTPLPENGNYWLQISSLKAWQWEVDSDNDGLSNRQEYYAGTDPHDPKSLLVTRIGRNGPELLVSWNGVAGARYEFLGSNDLLTWSPLLDSPIAISAETIPEVEVVPSMAKQFFGLQPLESPDPDSDGLSDREEALLGTRPDLADTDGDSVPDGREVFQTFTDPLIFDPLGGIISGQVFLDDDTDGDLTNAEPIESTTVYLDLNFNARLDDGEPRQETEPDGSYEFTRLTPGLYEVRQNLKEGEIQTLPAEVTPEIPDRLADEVVNYTHAPGALPGPYGLAPLDDWPGVFFTILGREVAPVDPAVMLLPFDERLTNPPIGTYSTSHHLSLPDTASVTVRFDEVIYDGPGPDFIVAVPRNGEGSTSLGEKADIALGPTVDELSTFTTNELLGEQIGRFTMVDLADFPGIPFVQFFKVTSKTSGEIAIQNSDGGFGFGGFQAINVLSPSTSGRRLRITSNEEFTGQDFGRFFQDLPPTVLFDTETQPQAGQPFTFRLIPTDDLGIASVVATANGQNATLDEDFRASLTPRFAGEAQVTATVTDTRGQSVTETWTVLVLDENGDLPFDPRDLAEQQGAGLTSIKIFTPASGDVPTEDTQVIGSIVSPTSAPNWTVSYAPLDSIDPLDLATPDPDYLEIGSGTGNQYSQSLGTLPIDSLTNGIYFLKIEATPSGGGLGNLVGQVFGVGVDEATLRPVITFADPLANSTLDLVQSINVSLESERTITEWSLEFAAYEEIDPNNLGAKSEAWTEIANGTGAFELSEIATLDTSLLANGRYLLRLTAFNDLRLGRIEAIEVEVSSPVKPGRNRVEFDDANLELAGFPLGVTRVYDSLKAYESGDFGFGWSLSLGDPEIFETVPDTGAGIFGATPFVTGTRIFFTTPDGERVGFTFEPEFSVASFVGALFSAKFTPDPGNPYKLEVPEGEDGFLSLRANGEARLALLGFPWNPDRYILVARDGTRYTYEQRLGLLSITDRAEANTLTFSPDSIAHSTGKSLNFERDSQGRIIHITEPGEKTWNYQYSENGNLISVTDPMGLKSTLEYDFEGRPHYLTSFTNPGGLAGRQYEYDDEGRIVAIIDERGNREEQAWDPAARSLTVTDRRGNETRLVFDDRGNVTEEIDALGNRTTFTFGDPRHPDIETDIASEILSQQFVLDDEGRPIEVYFNERDSVSLIFKYDEFGNLTQRDEIGGQTFYQNFDEKGQLIEIPDYGFPNAIQETRNYNDRGQLDFIATLDETLFISYDPETGLRSHERTELGIDRRYTYDDSARPLGITDALGETTTIDYRDNEGLFSINYANGATTTYTNLSFAALLDDEIENPAQPSYGITDPLGNQLVMEFDERENETSRTFPDGQSITRTFDAEDNLTTITTPGEQTETYTYDALNRPVKLTDAAGASITLKYDIEDRVIERIDRNGKRITYTYDYLGQVTTETWHDGDAIVREFTFTYRFRNGFLASVTDGSSTWEINSSNFSGLPSSYNYYYADQDGFSTSIRPSSENPEDIDFIRVTNIRAEAAKSLQVEIRGFLFNFRSHQPQLYIPAGDAPDINASVRQHFDDAGRITKLERFDFLSSADFFRQPISETLISRLPLGVAGSIRHQDVDGNLSFPASQFAYERDLKNRVTRRIQPTNEANFTYDVVDQILATTHTNFTDENFAYDPAGNPADGTYGDGDRLLTLGTLTFAYDAEGNLITETDSASGTIRRFTYDHRNQLTTVSVQESGGAEEVVLEYQYDYLGRVMFRIEGGQKFWILYQDRTPIAEFRDGVDCICSALFYDLTNPLNKYGQWTDEDGFRWFLTDALGTVHGILDHDGTPRHWIDYDTYGKPRTSVPADFGIYRFAGQPFRETAKLYENDLRHYNPDLGRFQQQDPIRFLSNDPNLYRYAENNPISKIDPLGTNSAIEYATLAAKVGACINSITKFSNCVDQLLGGAADAIIGGGGCVEITCIADLQEGSKCVGIKAPGGGKGFGPGASEGLGKFSAQLRKIAKQDPPPFCP